MSSNTASVLIVLTLAVSMVSCTVSSQWSRVGRDCAEKEAQP